MRHLAIPALLLATPAAAQDLMMGGINNSWSSTQLLLNSEKKAWAAPECVDPARWTTSCKTPRPPARTPSHPTANAAPTPAANRDALTFGASPERRKRNFDKMLARYRSANPAVRSDMAQFLAMDIIGEMGAQMRPVGLEPTNVADAVALYVNESWEIIHARPAPMNATRMKALSRQMAAAIAPLGLADADDATKQELAEDMIVQAALIGTAANQLRKGDPSGQMATLQASVRQGSRAALGLNLAAMEMTDEGLRDR